MGYVFLGGQEATAAVKKQRGDWQRVHRRYSNSVVQQDVFNLWIDHGERPNGARYAYAVLPDVTAEEMPAVCASLPVTVLEHSASLLAVSSRGGKLIQAAFFEPGRLAYGDGRTIEVNTACLVTFDETAAPACLHVADPTHRREAITARLSGRYLGSGAQYNADEDQTELTIDLPRDGFAGRSVPVQLRL
jgi:chondroitin AC lyase